MMAPPLSDLDALSLDELKELVVELLVRVSAQEEEIRRLREENARLKDLPRKPKLASGGMDKATEPERSTKSKARRRHRGQRQGGPRTPPVTEERTLTVAVPPGSRRRGFEPFTVQDLMLAPQVIRFRRERWVTPDGQEVVAPLPPEVTGHFGPGVARFVLMQHVQGQVTVERLLGQLTALGLCISKGQIIALLTANKDAFHAEKDAILEAGLATAAWVTVDDTGARHAGREEYTTHIGDDRFAWFATRPSKSRLNFLDLLRAGHADYVINAAAATSMVEHKVPEAVIAALLADECRSFADAAAWEAHLERFGLGAGHRRRVTEAAVVGAIVARGLLTDTVIVSDDAGQFDVFLHALCWIHAERHLRRITCVTEEQHRLVELQRLVVLRRPQALQGRTDTRPPDGPAGALRADLRPGNRLRRPRRHRGPDPGQQGRAAAGARPARDPAAHQRFGERRPLLRHQTPDLRRDALRRRQAGPRHLPESAQDLLQ